MGELEKLGSRYRIALKIVRDPRFQRLPCFHKGTYADDCLVQRVTQVKMPIYFNSIETNAGNSVNFLA